MAQMATVSDTVLASIRALAAGEPLLPRGARVLVAVSGGQDSCCLLHALASMRDERGLDLHAAHLDHSFRGEESLADSAFVGGLADALGVPATIERRDVPAVARRLRLTAQEAARRARHAFLDEVAQRLGADRIALGHTRDDHVETVLLNLLRGTGLRGLRGLAPLAGSRVRPLRNLPREVTAAYCRAHGLAYRTDTSNASPRYRRNRLRSELLPELATYYNPDVRGAIERLACIASADDDYLEAAAAKALEAAVVERSADRLSLRRAALSEMHPALRGRAMRLAVEAVRGSIVDVEHGAIAWAVEAATAGGPSGGVWSRTLRGANVRLRVAGPLVAVERVAAPATALRVERTVAVPGTTTVHELGVRVECQVAPSAEWGGPGAACEAALDLDALFPPLTVRNRRPGDRMRSLGAPGSRKIQDMLVDRGVPARDRDRLPLLVDRVGVIWVAGHAIAHRARVTGDTRTVLLVRTVSG